MLLFHFPLSLPPAAVPGLAEQLETLFPNTLASEVRSRISAPPGKPLTPFGVQSTA